MSETTTEPTAPAVEEWKPEPRTWVWKDLFTAPMLAFKPKCMLVSVVTLIAISLFSNLWMRLLASIGYVNVVTPLLIVLGLIIGAAIFSLGSTLVSIFMKADLLDDEFLSLKEALGQWKKRIVPAIMVPSFLILTVFGFIVLIYGVNLVSSIPYVGQILYVVLYPLVFLLGLLTVLVGIAVTLSTFLFPSIISVRKHGWFDNVIDTFEAVGTKPHVVVLNILLTKIIATVCIAIAYLAIFVPAASTIMPEVPGWNLAATVGSGLGMAFSVVGAVFSGQDLSMIFGQLNEMTGGGFHTFTGVILCIWLVPLLLFIIGYAQNVTLAGGMLTYLYVREDDYWDDEDLEDLDKLAKELEEEAKAEAAKAESDATAPAAASEETAVAESASDEAAQSEDTAEKTEEEPTDSAEETSTETEEAAESSEEPAAESAEEPATESESEEATDNADDNDEDEKKYESKS